MQFQSLIEYVPSTIYIRYRNPIQMQSFITIRKLLNTTFTVDSQILQERLTGNVTLDEVAIQVFDDGITSWVSADEWNNQNIFDDNMNFVDNPIWTADPLDLPLIHLGVSDFEFPRTFSTATAPEENFRRNTPDTFRVTQISNNNRPGFWNEMNHILLRVRR